MNFPISPKDFLQPTSEATQFFQSLPLETQNKILQGKITTYEELQGECKFLQE